MLHFKNKGWQLTSVVILFTILFSTASFTQSIPSVSQRDFDETLRRISQVETEARARGKNQYLPRLQQLRIQVHTAKSRYDAQDSLNASAGLLQVKNQLELLRNEILRTPAPAPRPRPVQRVERRPEPRPEPRPAHRRGWGRKVSRTDFAVLYDKINHAKRMAKRRGLYHRFRYKLNSVTSDFFAAKRINRRGHYRRAREMYDRTLGRTEHIIRQIRRKGRRSWR